jgi:MFS family permease
MGMMLRDKPLGSLAAAPMISVYSIGTVIGRISCGLALDKFPAPMVAAISMFPPAVGYALLATPLDTTLVIGAAMFMFGVAIGAEGDLQSYLVARHFDLRIFSTTLSLVYCGVFAAGASGALLISLSLKLTDSFAHFLAAMAVVVAIGSLLFLLLPREGQFEKIGAEGADLPEDETDRRALPQEITA